MINKNLVKSNFSKAASSYDKYAVVQRYMGEKLSDFITTKKKENKVLEIGAGCGYAAGIASVLCGSLGIVYAS